MTDDKKALYQEWDRPHDLVQFWVGVHAKALQFAQGDKDDPSVKFSRAKRNEAEAKHDQVVRWLSPSEGL